MKKFIGYSLGTLIGISHIGMIGMLSQGTKFPKLDLPIGEYTSYEVEAGANGYRIKYRAHDPKVLITTNEVDRPGGFLGLSRSKVKTHEQYYTKGIQESGGGLTAKQIACIKKKGAGEGTGRLVGGGVGTAVVTQTGMASIPIIGWVLAGATTMMGMDQGAEIGGQMAGDFAKECEDEEIVK